MGEMSLVESALQRPLATLITALLIAVLTTRIYNLFFHPLAKFPGPWIRAAFYWPHHYVELTGTGPTSLHELHKRYGPVVRFAPDSLSFIGAQAWKDIFGFRSDRTQIPKDYKRAPNAKSLENFLPLVLSKDSDHTRLRRVIAHAFSDTALRDQESLIQAYIARFNEGLGKLAEDSSARPDINMWNDWLSFDVLSDLTYGESFDSLKNQKTNSFITETFTGSQFSPVVGLTWDYIFFTLLLRGLLAFQTVKNLIDGGTQTISDDKVQKRIDQGADARNDFMKYIIRNNTNDSKTAVTMHEIRGMTTVFMAAGGEEPATLVTTALYYLMQYPLVLKRLQNELREAYQEAKNVTFASVEKLAYLNAVIQEAFRIHPPNAAHNSRRTAKTERIDGYIVPPGTVVEVASYAATKSGMNFAEPDVFAPERWLDDAPDKFSNDKKDASQPFLVGPRACIGKSLAMMIVRTTLASFLWRFDIEMADPRQDWLDQKFRIIWTRPELKVKLTQRRG